jgi:TatA/E family protein of Tat protein translocase
MFDGTPHSPVLAAFLGLGGGEVILILAVFVLLLGGKKLPDIMRGIGTGMSAFRKAADQEAHDAGKSAGGIFGKPAAEALSPDNQTAELYDPAVFRGNQRKRRFPRWLQHLWRSILKSLRTTH